MSEPLLAVRGLTVDYVVGAGRFHALSDVSFDLEPGKVVGIVGETGCGKSTLAHTIPRLLPEPPAEIKAGEVVFQGVDLLKTPKWKMPAVRGTGIGMIFQEPINSLNPSYRIYDQVAEAVRVRRIRESGAALAPVRDSVPHDYSKGPPVKTSEALTHAFLPSIPPGVRPTPQSLKTREIRAEVLEYLELVRINDPETILGLYPHELSGGMRQRIMIAIALSERPALLIADEPTSALDVTIQAQVLTLMKELMEEVRTSILFISHDLGVIAETADNIGVMYAGHLVEFGPVGEVSDSPRHPYTKALLRSVPRRYKTDGNLPSMAGSVPNLSRLPPGCAFHPRCVLARPICAEGLGPGLACSLPLPAPSETMGATPSESGPRGSSGHSSACYFAHEVANLP